MASVSKRQWTHNGVAKEAWTVRYFDAKGVRRSRQFDHKKSAEVYKREVEREAHSGLHVPHTESLTIANAIALYLTSVDQRIADGRMGRSRATSLEAAFRRHIIPEIGGVRFRELTVAQVDGLYRSLIAKGCGPWHAKSVVGMLKLVELFGQRAGYCKATPVAAALADLRGIRPNKVHSPSIELATKIMRHVLAFRPGIRARAAAMMACHVHLAACCGMRLGEIVALDRDHLDLAKGEVRIRRSITVYREIKGPKTASGNRDVPLPSHLVEMLRSWLTDHYVDNPGRLLFVSPSGQPPTHSDLNSRWRNLLREVDAFDENDPLHFHSLRHFAGSWWLHQGVKIGDTSKMLGHANPGITMRVYAHALSDESQRREQIRSASALLMAPDDAREPQNRISN